MKKISVVIAATLALLFSVPAFADLQISQNGTREGQFRKINLLNGVTVAANGDISFATPTITGGTIDGAIIGGSTPAAGTFTSINDTGLTASRVLATDGSKNIASTFNSAALSAALSDETGSGFSVFATSPQLTTPAIDVFTGTSGTLTGDITYQTNLIANGRYGAQSTVLFSSSTTLQQANIPYAVIYKAIGNAPNETTTLPAGKNGQEVTLIVYSAGPAGTWIVKPDTAAQTPVLGTGFTSITFNTAGQRAVVQYINSTIGWIIKNTGSTGASAQPTISAPVLM